MRTVTARSLVATLTLALLPLAALGLAGCSSGPTPPARAESATPAASATPVSGTDGAFLTGLAANQRQALQIGALVEDKYGVDPQVRVLAEEVIGRQQEVLDRLEAWPVPTSGQTPTPPLPQAELDGLAGADGAQSGRIYLQVMVGSHIEAVQLARTEVAQGSDPEAIALAQEVIDASSAELDQMRVLLGGV